MRQRIEADAKAANARKMLVSHQQLVQDRGEERSTEFARSTNASGLWSQDVMKKNNNE